MSQHLITGLLYHVTYMLVHPVQTLIANYHKTNTHTHCPPSSAISNISTSLSTSTPSMLEVNAPQKLHT